MRARTHWSKIAMGTRRAFRGEVLTFVLDYCQLHAFAASRDVQRPVAERFSCSVSASQLNRIRAAHGLSRKDPPREKKLKKGLTIASGSNVQAGGLLLEASATETGLLTQLEQALPPARDPHRLPLAGCPAVRRRLVFTLLFLGVSGLQRTWDLRGYTAEGLALLTGRTRASSYRYTETFLSQVARADGAERFTEMLGSWATHLWHPTLAVLIITLLWPIVTNYWQSLSDKSSRWFHKPLRFLFVWIEGRMTLRRMWCMMRFS